MAKYTNSHNHGIQWLLGNPVAHKIIAQLFSDDPKIQLIAHTLACGEYTDRIGDLEKTLTEGKRKELALLLEGALPDRNNSLFFDEKGGVNMIPLFNYLKEQKHRALNYNNSRWDMGEWDYHRKYHNFHNEKDNIDPSQKPDSNNSILHSFSTDKDEYNIILPECDDCGRYEFHLESCLKDGRYSISNIANGEGFDKYKQHGITILDTDGVFNILEIFARQLGITATINMDFLQSNSNDAQSVISQFAKQTGIYSRQDWFATDGWYLLLDINPDTWVTKHLVLGGNKWSRFEEKLLQDQGATSFHGSTHTYDLDVCVLLSVPQSPK